jgi:hypothetical protein
LDFLGQWWSWVADFEGGEKMRWYCACEDVFVGWRTGVGAGEGLKWEVFDFEGDVVAVEVVEVESIWEEPAGAFREV